MIDIPNRQLIGESPPFLELLESASRAAALSKPVLVIGERGTGKELIAERLHYLSPRWERPLVKLNCAALPESLLETELFGHEAGAFTGAGKRHHGRFERADGGTLFLDEIASMSLRLQEKLLRVLEYGEYERVGGSETLQADIRVIGAANADLPSMARDGDFRADLLDRLSFDVLTLPPLRYRSEDIPVLADYFALGMVKSLKRNWFPGFSDEVREAMLAYDWPGNLREMKNVVERAVYRSDPDYPIDEIMLDPFASPYRPLRSAELAEPVLPSPTPVTTERVYPYDFKAEIKAYEKRLLVEALRHEHYNQTRTAKVLKLGYHQLRRYIGKYSLDPDSVSGR